MSKISEKILPQCDEFYKEFKDSLKLTWDDHKLLEAFDTFSEWRDSYLYIPIPLSKSLCFACMSQTAVFAISDKGRYNYPAFCKQCILDISSALNTEYSYFLLLKYTRFIETWGEPIKFRHADIIIDAMAMFFLSMSSIFIHSDHYTIDKVGDVINEYMLSTITTLYLTWNTLRRARFKNVYPIDESKTSLIINDEQVSYYYHSRDKSPIQESHQHKQDQTIAYMIHTVSRILPMIRKHAHVPTIDIPEYDPIIIGGDCESEI